MIYIYPYGNFGKSIEKCLKAFNLQYNIIDDSNNKISLNNTNIDNKKDIILICIAENPNKIIDKLNLKGNFNHIDGVLYCLDILKTEFKFDKPNHNYEDILAELFGITNCLDQNSTSRSEFIKFFNQYGNFINNYYKNKFKDIQIWGGVDVSFSNMKHLYKIPSILEQNGLNLIYIFQTKYYKEDPNKKFIIILNYYLWHFLEFLPNILSSANMKVSNNTKLYFIEHAYCTPRVLPIISNNPKQELNGYLLKNKNNINLIGNKQDYEICEKIYNSIIIKAGYPSLDKNLENYSNDCKKEWVMIAFVDDAIDENSAFNLAKVLLENEYKVIARVHPAFKENIKKLYSISNLNFIFDESGSPIESFKNSFTVITNHSSIAHTYPLTTLRKAILFMPSSSLDKEIYGKTFFDKNLHLKATNFDEVLLNLKELEAKKDDLYEQEKIRSYRNNEVYNLGHSSEFIANFILEKLKEK
ncbi:hypothetical protein [Campylobacter fetus]|uniref:hypothetical protein n=1 Tax=Campylobacter fetus TaxID=196 RepID=UPI00081893D4|nr:hypothetical protein [Campylobacter fetus]OCR84727.1 hypothetical protein CFT12S05168_08470 [Campylobacter fetus subsp. testudinum]